MDLGLSEEQEMLRQFARDFLEKECPESHVRDMEEDDRGYSQELWAKMAEQGWMGLVVPEAYGGVGMGYLDLIILVEEFGRALVPGPFIPNCVATIALLEAADEAQKQAHLPAIASGRQVWTLAFTEPSARFDAPPPPTKRRGSGSGRGRGRPPPRLGEEGRAWPVFQRIANKATVLECAYLVGLSQQAFDITVNYTKERNQFGRPIASFQALQHKAADMATDVDGCRYITYKAAWAVAEDEPDADEQVHVAKAWVSDASRRVVANAQQMHGGIGFTKDYKIQLYFRRQKAAELAWGDADFHREGLAQALGI